MAKFNGLDIFKLLLFGVAGLFIVSQLAPLIGGDFQFSDLGDINQNAIWGILIGTLAIYLFTLMINKVEAGNLTSKAFITLLILGVILYILAKALENLLGITIISGLEFSVAQMTAFP